MDITKYLTPATLCEIKLPFICTLSRSFQNFLDSGLNTAEKMELGKVTQDDMMDTLAHLGRILNIVLAELSQYGHSLIDKELSVIIDTGACEMGVVGENYLNLSQEEFARVCFEITKKVSDDANDEHGISPITTRVMGTVAFYQALIWGSIDDLGIDCKVVSVDDWVVFLCTVLITLCATFVAYGYLDPMSLIVQEESTSSIIV